MGDQYSGDEVRWDWLGCESGCSVSVWVIWLLPTFGENVIPTAHLETYLLGKMVTCSILILPAVYIHVQGSVYNNFTKY